MFLYNLQQEMFNNKRSSRTAKYQVCASHFKPSNSVKAMIKPHGVVKYEESEFKHTWRDNSNATVAQWCCQCGTM